jgi:IclR family acetate operon transcriptional repressor
MTNADQPETLARYTVGSLHRALRLVDIIASGPVDGLTVSELARQLGASKSTTFALARTLLDFNYLRILEPGTRYQLGLALVRLGDISASGLPLAAICQPVLHDLNAKTGLTIRAAINENGRPLFIERVDAPGAIRFHAPLGVPELPHVSSAGKAILASMTDREVASIIAVTGMPRRTANTITTLQGLFDDLAEVRRRGYAVDDEEDFDGVFCVGAAFFDHSGSCSGTISATGIKRDLPEQAVRDLGALVRESANGITRMLGGTPRELVTTAVTT